MRLYKQRETVGNAHPTTIEIPYHLIRLSATFNNAVARHALPLHEQFEIP